MNIILLSGGSGKRLWPLSNDVRSMFMVTGTCFPRYSDYSMQKAPELPEALVRFIQDITGQYNSSMNAISYYS